MTRQPFLLTLAVVLAGAAVLGGCHGKPEAPVAESAQARTVRVVQVANRQLDGALTASGPLVPREEAAVAPEVTGYRVARVLVEAGAYVRKGQTLAELDSALIRSQIDQQAALANQAAVQAEQAEAQAARVQGLDGQGVLSQEQIDQRRFAARAARATAEAQAAGLRDLRTRAGKLAVTAPVSGIVLERTVRPGDMSAGGATPWFRLARDGQVELEAQISEATLAGVRPGQTASVRLSDGAQVRGVVRLVSPSVDPQTRLGTVRITLPVNKDIRSGGFAQATFNESSSPVPTVPESAIRYDAEGSSVMVVGTDNKVRQAAIKTGSRGGGFVELVTGPQVGARVLERAASLILPGDVIRPIVVTSPAAPAPAPAPTAKAPAAK